MRESPIIDPRTGRGFKKNDLSRHITRAQLAGIRQASPGYSVASWLTPERLAGVLNGAIDGDMDEYLVLAEEMEERDLHYASQLRTRKLAVSGLAPVVEAASEEQKDIDLADEVRELVNQSAFSDMVFDLLDALGKGFSVVEVVWKTEGGRWLPDQYLWADPRFFRYDRETLRELRHKTYSVSGDVDGAPLESFKYLVHTPRIKSGLPVRNGLARLAATLFMLKGYTLKDWWAFAEVFGMPIRVGKYGPNATDEEINTLVSAISNIASDAGAAIPESMQLELIETAKGNSGDSLFENMAGWVDSQLSKGILGQTMTADNGSSLSQAQVHNEVRRDIQIDDARQLGNTLNTLVRWVIDLNHGPQAQYPKLVLPVIEQEDLKAMAEALGPMIDRGLRVKSLEILDRFGLAEPDDSAEVLRPMGATSEAPPALNHQLALSRSLSGSSAGYTPSLGINRQALDAEQEMAALEEELLADWQPTMTPIIEPVERLLEDVDSLEDFLKRLPELVDENSDYAMDARALMLKLAEAAFKARGVADSEKGSR